MQRGSVSGIEVMTRTTFIEEDFPALHSSTALFCTDIERGKIKPNLSRFMIAPDTFSSHIAGLSRFPYVSLLYASKGVAPNSLSTL